MAIKVYCKLPFRITGRTLHGFQKVKIERITKSNGLVDVIRHPPVDHSAFADPIDGHYFVDDTAHNRKVLKADIKRGFAELEDLDLQNEIMQGENIKSTEHYKVITPSKIENDVEEMKLQGIRRAGEPKRGKPVKTYMSAKTEELIAKRRVSLEEKKKEIEQQNILSIDVKEEQVQEIAEEFNETDIDEEIDARINDLATDSDKLKELMRMAEGD